MKVERVIELHQKWKNALVNVCYANCGDAPYSIQQQANSNPTASGDLLVD